MQPERVVGPACRHLERFTGIEQTALLDAVADALAALPAQASRSEQLLRVVQSRWQQLNSLERPDKVDNFPGVMARLLEIAGRCGGDWLGMLEQVQPHDLKRVRILHQFVQRPFQQPQRRELYVSTLQALLDGLQTRSFSTVLGIAARDTPPAEFESLLRAVITRGTSDSDS